MNDQRNRFRKMLEGKKIITAPGAFDALSARIIEQAGFSAVYLTGGGLSRTWGFPDLGLMTLVENASFIARVCDSVEIPVIADADTGYGNAINLIRTIQEYERAEVAAVHIEDQMIPKKCGHMEGKRLVSVEEMVGKIRAACEARRDPDFIIIARTDAKASLGVDEAIRRLKLYVEHGADMAALGDFYTLEEYQRIVKEVKVPIVACASDHSHFSLQPDFSVDEWKKAGVKMVIYWHLPLFAAMKAVESVVKKLKDTGTTRQMRNEVFTYEEYEKIVKLQKWLNIDERSE